MVEVKSHRNIFPDTEEGLKISNGDSIFILREIKEASGETVFIARNKDKRIDGEIASKELETTALPKWFKNYDREKVEKKLKKTKYKDGDFFIRPVNRGKDREFAASVKFKEQVHHFKLSTGSRTEGWTCNDKCVSSLQNFVKTFQDTPLISHEKRKKHKIKLSKNALTDVIILPEPGIYYGEEYEGGYEEDSDDDQGEEYGDGDEEEADFS